MELDEALLCEYLRRTVRYDAETGKFFAIVRTGTKIREGQELGIRKQLGHIEICVAGKYYRAHRLVWLYVYGKWPSKTIDHIDHDQTNNRLSNLREATSVENSRNRRKQSNNRAGHKGVSFHKQQRRWRAHIVVDGKQLYLGSFMEKERAADAYRSAALKHHGEFACCD